MRILTKFNMNKCVVGCIISAIQSDWINKKINVN